MIKWLHAKYRRLIPRWRRFLFTLLQYHRRYIRRGTVIGITGSCGKTTAKELIYHVLSSRWRGTKEKDSLNGFYNNALLLLRTWPGRSAFCVMEVGTDRPGKLDFICRGLRLDIGVVLVIGLDHYRLFRTREAVAEEKQHVVAHLPETGLAILNADDPYVADMAKRTLAPVVMFGQSPNADIRTENISAAWPERLSFDVWIKGERFHVQTRLCGDMWMPSVLPSFAVGLHMGMTASEIIAAIETYQPFYNRMEPREMPDGSTFILDDWKAPFWSLDHTLIFLEQARATKKILILGTISDTSGAQSKQYAKFIRRALESVDHVVVTGSLSDMFKTSLAKFSPDQVRVIANLKDVSEYLDRISVPGSLVLLKGTNTQDHLSRLMHHRLKPVSCWSRECRLHKHCHDCAELYRKADGH